MPLYQPVPAPIPQAPVNSLLLAAQQLGLLTGQVAATYGDAPTEPPGMGDTPDAGPLVPDQNMDASTRAWHEVGGVNWLPYPCTGGGTWDPCDPAATPLVTSDEFPAGMEAAGFPLKVGVSCTAVDPFTREQSQTYAVNLLNVMQHKIAGSEFWKGTQAQASGWPNPYLTDNTSTVTVDTGLTKCGGLALLENLIAGNAIDGSNDPYCGGARGFIHASPTLVSAWSRDGHVLRVGGPSAMTSLIVTTLGTPVITGPGYDGTGPGATTPTEQTTGITWAYATGAFNVRLSPVQVYDRKSSIDYDTNVYEQWATRAANVAFDPCCVLAVSIDLDECAPLTPTP